MKTALLSMRITEAESYTERRNSIAYEYVDLLERLNFLVVLVPMNSKNIDIYFKLNKIDLVVLSGGNNVDPKLYDSPETLSDVYPERDKVEAELIDIAIDNKIKVLGICRGFHFINIFFG
jgi:putative glutamine amidotransferase